MTSETGRQSGFGLNTLEIHLFYEEEKNKNILEYVMQNFLLASHLRCRYFIKSLKEIESVPCSGRCITIGYTEQLINENRFSIRIWKSPVASYIKRVKLSTARSEFQIFHNLELPLFGDYFSGVPNQAEPLISIQTTSHPLLSSIQHGDGPAFLHMDLFFNTFYHLSAKKEYEYEETHGQEMHPFHINKLYDEENHRTPTVTYLFRLLENTIILKLKETGHEILYREKIPPGKKFAVCLGHDVDAVEKYFLLNLKRAVYEMPRSIESVFAGNIATAGRRLARMAKFLLSKDDYWKFDSIQEMEADLGFRSIFYFYSKTNFTDFKEKLNQYLYDPRYDIKNDVRVAEKISELNKNGWEVALHGSYNSYRDADILRKEKEEIENIIKDKVLSVRQHFLRFSTHETWAAYVSAGLKYNSSFCVTPRRGYRAACCDLYYPFNFKEEKKYEIVDLPTVTADYVYFDFQNYTDEECLEDIRHILDEVKKLNGIVAINWHQRVFSNDFDRAQTYKKVLEWIYENNGCGTTAKEIVNYNLSSIMHA